MRLTPEERSILDRIAADGGTIVQRAVDWCAINSGSRNLDGLEAQRAVLVDALSVLPAAPMDVPLAPTVEIGADGRERELAHPASIALVVRPEAPVQVVLTGHYDTVYPAESRASPWPASRETTARLRRTRHSTCTAGPSRPPPMISR